MRPQLVRTARQTAGFAAYLERRFRRDGALNMASSLAYTSLLSLVPLMAIGLAVLAAFPAFTQVRQQLQDVLFGALVPQVGQQVQSYLSAFVSNAGKLTAAGVVGLAFTAVMLLVTIEVSLNQIFRVATPRTPTSRLLVYWTVLTLGPLLLGASFSLSAWLYAAGDWAARAGLSVVIRQITQATPTLLLMVTFTLLYLAVPNRRVKARDALAGGVAAALAFGVLRWGFSLYVGRAHSYQSIYGAVATVPIFLFWMYLSWAVVLFGAELTAALPEWRRSRPDLGDELPPRRRLALAVTVLATLLGDAQRNARGRSRLDLLEIAGEAEEPFLAVLNRLCAEGYVVQTAGARYVLGRDLTPVSLGDLVHALGLGLGESEAEDCTAAWMTELADHLSTAAHAEAEALDTPLRGILEAASRQPGILRPAGGAPGDRRGDGRAAAGG